MRFEKEGQRPPYEKPYAQRRDALNALVLAECAEHKGRFIDDIINGIYLICDETSWVVPAHNYKDIRFGTHDGNNTALLPLDDNIVIELRGAKTGHDLALVYYLLKDELDAVSPEICRRIEIKTEERIISLYEKYDDYFWKREINNWNPQCNIHCLVAAMIMIDDDERRKSFVQKVLKSANYYISAFANDGGCDEGVLYWEHSCANFFRIADFIKQITYGKIDITLEPKVVAMSSFPANMYIGKGRVIYKNGNPVVIDPGTGQYVSSSFTPKRYEIWYNNSLHHNLPSIDGLMQKNGPRYDGVVMDEAELVAPAYAAADVEYKNDRFSLDIAPCYGCEKVKKWKRDFYFDRECNKIEVKENYELSSECKIDLVFMLAQKPEITNGVILMAEGVKLCIENMTARVEDVSDFGIRMVHQWDKVYRLTLLTTGKCGTIEYCFKL